MFQSIAKFSGFLTLTIISLVVSHPATPDGPLYNAKQTEAGPISKEIMEAHPRLSFLGWFNGTYFYIDRTEANRASAYESCLIMGMNLAVFRTQAALNYIANLTSSGDNEAWTMGVNSDEFVWSESLTGGVWTKDVLENGLVERGGDQLGLVLIKYSPPRDSKLRVMAQNYLGYYYCSM